MEEHKQNNMMNTGCVIPSTKLFSSLYSAPLRESFNSYADKLGLTSLNELSNLEHDVLTTTPPLNTFSHETDAQILCTGSGESFTSVMSSLPNSQQQKKKPQKDLSIPTFHRRIMVFDTETSGLMPKHRPGTPFPAIGEYPYIMQFSWIIYNISTNTVEEVVDEYINIPKSVTISPESIAVHGITREISNKKGKPILPILNKFFEAYMKCDCIVAHNLHFDGELVRKEMWRNRDQLMRKFSLRNRCTSLGSLLLARETSPVGVTSGLRNCSIAIPDRVNMMCGVFSKKFNTAYNIDTFCTMMNTIELCGIEFPKKTGTIVGVSTSPTASSPPQNTRKKFPRLNELYGKLFDDAIPKNLHNSIIDVIVCLRCFLKIRGVKDVSADEFGEWINKYSEK